MAAPFELVIFDCDGVLVDSERPAVPIDVAILRDVGIEMTEAEVMERFVGRSAHVMYDLSAGALRPADLQRGRGRRRPHSRARGRRSSPTCVSSRRSSRRVRLLVHRSQFLGGPAERTTQEPDGRV